MTTNEPKSPYGRGFIAAATILTTILACGAVYSSGPTPPPAAPATFPSARDPGTHRAVTPGPALLPRSDGAPASATDLAPKPKVRVQRRGAERPPAARPTPAAPAPRRPQAMGPTAAPASGARRLRTRPAPPPTWALRPLGRYLGAGGCGLPEGDQVFRLGAPAVDGWEVSRRVVVPRSAAYGPGAVDRDGFRRCFAHSPTGAVFAAYNVIAALADQRQAIATVGKLMVPGATPTRCSGNSARKRPTTRTRNRSSSPAIRVLDATRDRATVMLAIPVRDRLHERHPHARLARRRLATGATTARQPVGAPYAQLRDLTDFVTWSGV